MIRSLYYVPGQPIQKDVAPRDFPELIQNQQGLLWVDFVNEPPETSLTGFQISPPGNRRRVAGNSCPSAG
jgi:hypothetical protein